eukprot:gene31282-40652_t
MFRRNKDSLPVFGTNDSSSSRGNSNGVEGIPTVVASIAWVVVSILVIIFGIYHCRSNSYSYKIECSPTVCIWSKVEKGVQEAVSFARSDFLHADIVRIDSKGEVVDNEAMKLSNKRAGSFGYSVRLKARLPVEPESKIRAEKSLILSPHDMGRRQARSCSSRLQSYLTRASESVNKTGDSRSVTFAGLMSCFFGLISLVTACIFGQWADKPARRSSASARGGGNSNCNALVLGKPFPFMNHLFFQQQVKSM